MSLVLSRRYDRTDKNFTGREVERGDGLEYPLVGKVPPGRNPRAWCVGSEKTRTLPISRRRVGVRPPT